MISNILAGMVWKSGPTMASAWNSLLKSSHAFIARGVSVMAS